jgi:two-component system sensor histidine kinase PilS (NtrC family)
MRMSQVAEATVQSESSGLRVPLTISGEDFGWRILRLLNVSRWIFSLLLIVAYFTFTEPRIIGNDFPLTALITMAAMFAFSSIEGVLLYREVGRVSVHACLQSGADVVLIPLLLHTSGGISSGLGGLLVVSIGSLSLLVAAERAYLIAAMSVLALLLQQLVAVTLGIADTADFAPSGILGGVILTIVAVTQRLRRWIVETEALAEQRGVDLKNLVELNDYIIQHLRESIVVVDSDDRIRLINESAVKQLGRGSAVRGVPLTSISAELAKHLTNWRTRNPESEKHSTAFNVGEGTVRVEPHFARLGPDRSAGVLIFLEDTSLIAERVQQTKLAALGRLSASIAHEIRNPVGALSHAGQLLAESPIISASEQRLTDIIRVNAGRVSQIVDSIMTLSRGDRTAPETLALLPWVRNFADEFARTLELYESAVQVSPESVDVQVEMDRTHLHQIVWNLCENAVKYASAAAGAISVELCCGNLNSSGRPFLEIADRGSGVRPEQVEHIFEPFFTAEQGGTGLGLYISRELCERNGGSLRYHPRPGGGSLFRIVFADPERWQAKKDIA